MRPKAILNARGWNEQIGCAICEKNRLLSVECFDGPMGVQKCFLLIVTSVNINEGLFFGLTKKLDSV